MRDLLKAAGAAALTLVSLAVLPAAAKVILVTVPHGTALQDAVFAATDHGDTVILVNPGNYGPAIITRGVTIIAVPGAGIFSPDKECLFILAPDGANGATVTVDGLTCDMGGAARTGISYNRGRRLILNNVTVKNGASSRCGLRFVATRSIHALSITRSTFNSFGAKAPGGAICLSIFPNVAMSATFDALTIEGNATGVTATPVEGGGTLDVLIANSVIVRNGVGVSANGVGVAFRVANSVITRNGLGLTKSGGATLISMEGNSVDNPGGGNTFDTTVPKN